jgi:large subunit ribosomal protein L24
MKIRKGDRVVVLSGKDKGREGVVSRALPERRKVIVEGVNIARRHQKPRAADKPGGIIDKAMPIDVSNVAVISPRDGKATRVGYQVAADGTKIRVCKRTGAEIPEVRP